MKIEQIYTGCLAEAAYYIESKGECAIVDPLRETSPYLNRANKNGARIKYIFETHFHADFVSGHLDLSEKTNAPIVFGPNAKTSFKSYIAKDGEEFPIGELTIKVLHTPGHTLESVTYLLLDGNKKPHAIFSGDTLFIGDVGRPDLAIKSDLTENDLAGMLYDSLWNKILPLPDDIIVYPGHGAGSACGKNMSKETFDSLGHQKLVNYALQPMNRTAFIEKVTEGLTPPPQYFSKNVMMNKKGSDSIDEIYERGLKALVSQAFEEAVLNFKAVIIDTRDAKSFAKGFIPGSINIGLNGQFAPWVGALVTDIKQTIVLVAEPGNEEEAITRLARVGYDHTIGYLENGFQSWIDAGKPFETISSVTAPELEQNIKSTKINILDIRKPDEYEAGHVKNSTNLPLDFLNEWMPELDKNKKYYIHCAGGYRSMIAASILKSRGFEDIINVEGGFGAIRQTNIETE